MLLTFSVFAIHELFMVVKCLNLLSVCVEKIFSFQNDEISTFFYSLDGKDQILVKLHLTPSKRPWRAPQSLSFFRFLFFISYFSDLNNLHFFLHENFPKFFSSKFLPEILWCVSVHRALKSFLSISIIQ